MNRSIYQIKQAWAGLRTKKGFLATIVATLGISLGALLCILTLAYVLIGKPLPYPDQERLYLLEAMNIDGDGEELMPAHPYPSLIHLFDNQEYFTQAALVDYGTGETVLSSQPTQPAINATYVTPNWFTLLDIPMELGRTFVQTEAKDSFNPVVVLTYDFWQSEFGGDSAILEQSLTFNGVNFRVVGVTSSSFIEPELHNRGMLSDVFLPWDYNEAPEEDRQAWGRVADARKFIGKLDSSMSVSQVEQSLTALYSNTWQENVTGISFFDGWQMRIDAKTFGQIIIGDSQNTVLLLLAGVIGLVLVASANITNLFMSRTAEQQKQLAIQAALGAKQSHLFKSLLAQSGLIVFMSVIVGLVIANVGFWLLQEHLAMRLPRVEELSINIVTLGCALIIAVLLALFFARLSANMIDYRALNSALQSSGKGTGVQVSQKVRKLLIISQVSIATVLVFVNIGLLKDSVDVINQPLGFETENVSTMNLSINSADSISGEQRIVMMMEVKDKLSQLPQIERVTHAMSPFIDGIVFAQVVEATEENLIVKTKQIDNEYFEVLDQPLIEGEFFSEADVTDRTRLMIVNDVYAAKLAGDNGSAIGSKVRFGRSSIYTVTGVVKGVVMPTETEVPMRAFPLSRGRDYEFMIKFKPNQTVPRETLIKAIKEVSGQLQLLEMKSLHQQKNELLFTQYTTAITSAVLAVLTFILASVGLYGILNYATQMRRFEIGIRLAIGAKRAKIISLIIKENAVSVGIGFVVSLMVLLGLFIGFEEELTNYINSQLIVVFVLTLVLVSATALFACYWPLRAIINKPAIHSLRNAE